MIGTGNGETEGKSCDALASNGIEWKPCGINQWTRMFSSSSKWLMATFWNMWLMFKSRIMILYRESLGTNLSWVINLGTAACLLNISRAAFWFTLESCKSWSSPFLLRGFHITITLYTPTAKEGLYGVCNVPSIGMYRFCSAATAASVLCTTVQWGSIQLLLHTSKWSSIPGGRAHLRLCTAVCAWPALSLYYT